MLLACLACSINRTYQQQQQQQAGGCACVPHWAVLCPPGSCCCCQAELEEAHKADPVQPTMTAEEQVETEKVFKDF